MAIFTIYQNHAVRNNSGIVNQLGWDGSAKKIPAIHTHLEMTFIDTDVDGVWKPEYINHYAPVATVVVDEHIESKDVEAQLERVFGAANGHGKEYDEYCNFAKAHSLSVGDLVRTPEGDFWVVAGCGFAKVEVEA